MLLPAWWICLINFSCWSHFGLVYGLWAVMCMLGWGLEYLAFSLPNELGKVVRVGLCKGVFWAIGAFSLCLHGECTCAFYSIKAVIQGQTIQILVANLVYNLRCIVEIIMVHVHGGLNNWTSVYDTAYKPFLRGFINVTKIYLPIFQNMP